MYHLYVFTLHIHMGLPFMQCDTEESVYFPKRPMDKDVEECMWISECECLVSDTPLKDI